MNQIKWLFEREINGLLFFKYPHLDILISITPFEALVDSSRFSRGMYSDKAQDAATFLALILDKGRQFGLQIFIYLEHPDSLPEEHPIASAILSLENSDRIYCTPPSAVEYSVNRFQTLFLY